MIGGIIVKGEDGLDILPLTKLGRDAGATIGLGPVDEVVHGEDILCFGRPLDDGGFCAPWMCRYNTIEPVFDSVSITKSAHESRTTATGTMTYLDL